VTFATRVSPRDEQCTIAAGKLRQLRSLFALVLMSILIVGVAPAQERPKTMDEGYRDMYNLQFDSAHHFFQQWEQAHPQDPLGPVSDAAAYLFSEFDRLHILESELFIDDSNFEKRSRMTPDPVAKRAFEAKLEKAQQLADSILTRNPNDPDALFAKIMGLGLRGDYAALVEKRDMAGLSYLKTGRALAEKLLAQNSSYYDAYLAVGVENYLLSLKPAPMRWLLRMTGAQTDHDTGLRQLRITAEKGHYLLPYARLLLAVAALRDKDRSQAKNLLGDLAREFPENRLYARELAKLN
jgi:hypothetical protein